MVFEVALLIPLALVAGSGAVAATTTAAKPAVRWGRKAAKKGADKVNRPHLDFVGNAY